MKYFIIVFISALLLFALNSCYYDKESQLYPFSGSCDTLNVTYSMTVKGIIQNGGCLACHATPASSGGNIILDNYTDVKTVAQNGKLYGAINHNPGFSPMPQSGGKLTNCDISKIKKWITDGVLNN